MFNENQIKALIELIQKEPNSKIELKAQLAKIIKAQPQKFKRLIEDTYGGKMPNFVGEVINNVHRENLKKPFAWFFDKHNPDIYEGLVLLCKFINLGIKDEQIKKEFNALRTAISEVADSSFDTFHKAEVFANFFFNKLNFKLENLDNDPKLLSIYDIIKTRRAAPFAMAVLYVLMVRDLDVFGDITDIGGKPLVRFRDAISFEPVYIDITARGQFVGEDECHIYAASRGIKWQAKVLSPLSSKEIIRRLAANLIYTYARQGSKHNELALSLLRSFIKQG
ncbi:MAG: transglutaminase-like domain-containing protein [Elusimicrobiota bacterium]|jgi:regulator of sirC expression with transglutaminase-like and TPR domain|nr:transglutaminase-like domain-containing protein [Elusimicrobiota bacterium]